MKTYLKTVWVNFENTLNFGTNQENRKLNHAHLQKMKAQWQASPQMIPAITVNKVTHNIIDGQHRLKAYQDLIKDGSLEPNTKIEVRFVEVPVDEEKEAIVNANTNSKNWSLDDYITSYVKPGNDYERLRNWCMNNSLANENNKPKYRYGAAIIKGKTCQSELKDGTFTCTLDDLDIADKVHAQMSEIMDICKLTKTGPWVEQMAVSWKEVRNLASFDEWKRSLKKLMKRKSFKEQPKDNKKNWDKCFNEAHRMIAVNKAS